DQVVVGLDAPGIAFGRIDLQGRGVPTAGEVRLPGDDLPAVLGGEADVLVRAHVVDQGVLAADQGGEVGVFGPGADAGEAAGVQGAVAGPGCGQQRLRGHAAGVDAGAAD